MCDKVDIGYALGVKSLWLGIWKSILSTKVLGVQKTQMNIGIKFEYIILEVSINMTESSDSMYSPIFWPKVSLLIALNL